MTENAAARSSRRRALAALTGALVACAEEPPPGPECATGVVRVAEAPSGLPPALDAARPGDCVILGAGVHRAGLTIGPGVEVRGPGRAAATLEGGLEGATIALGEGASLSGVAIRGGEVGVAIEAASARLLDVDVEGAKDGDVSIRCEDPSCLGAGLEVLIADSRLAGSRYGVLARGARVTLRGTTIREHGSTGLTGGAGVYALAGADLSLVESTVEQNQLGVVADGAETRLRIVDSVVAQNADRGVWVQGLTGSGSTPAFVVEGSRGRFAENGVTAIGTLGVTGISIRDVAIVDTLAKPITISATVVADVGDGLGLFAGTSSATIAGVELAGNGRAQALVDRPGPGVRFGANVVELTRGQAGLHRIVVQRGGSPVVAPAADVSATAELPVSAPTVLAPGP